MSACSPIRFNGVSMAKYRAIVARVRAQADSVSDSGNTGSAQGQSPLGQFTAEWTYDPAALSLIITVTKKPFLVSESLMAAKMQALVDSISL